jgi:hypothetical protein
VLKAGRVIGWVLTVLVATGYTTFLVKDLIIYRDHYPELKGWWRGIFSIMLRLPFDLWCPNRSKFNGSLNLFKALMNFSAASRKFGFLFPQLIFEHLIVNAT